MDDKLQTIENVFIAAECEFDPHGHWIKVSDPHKLYVALQALCDKQSIRVRIDELAKFANNISHAHKTINTVCMGCLADKYFKARLSELESAPINSESKGADNG